MSDVMIEARALTKHYGPIHALDDASFEVRRGEVLGFLGPNGAGKTTTMKILTCFIAPTSGTALIGGVDVFDDPLEVRRMVGYLPETTPLYTDMRVLEYLDFVAKMRGFNHADGRKRIQKVVEETSLSEVIGQEIRSLSKGFRQRVGLAQALVHEPPILILDEPLSGLDPNQAAEIRELVRQIGRERTIILSTHNLPEVQMTCGRVLIVSRGKIVANDTPDELKARAGKPHYLVTVRAGADGAAPPMHAAIERVGGVERVAASSASEPGEVVFEVTPSDSKDLRPELFRAAVDSGTVLLGLERRGEDLEQVFRQLTTKGDA
ncbi:MAG: ATP-binding cassette domain-containing protein [Myxococcales bacterium]|nr:ATP-binding cassette domain-containing protein [Myxococcales bacterium]